MIKFIAMSSDSVNVAINSNSNSNSHSTDSIAYDWSFVCTYKQMDDDDQDTMYQLHLANAFKIETWDDHVVNKTCQDLYGRLRTQQPEALKRLAVGVAACPSIQFLVHLFCPELATRPDDYSETLFRILFKFETFDLWHRCLGELLEQGVISEPSLMAVLDTLR